MTDTVSIGGETYELRPMNAMEATEVMFILAPYVLPLALGRNPLDKLEALIRKIQETNPSDLFRLLAYMLHVDADKLISENVKGKELVHALVGGFNHNSLPDLINVAHAMRISNRGWADGS